MRSWLRPIGLLVLAVLAGDAAAQEAPVPEGPADYLVPPCPAKACPATTVDFIFGLPTGFRFQRSVDDDHVWHLEGFLGLELIFPIAGGGIRRRYEPFCGRHDAVIIAPGVDAYVLYNVFWDSNSFIFGGGPPVAGIFTADVDILWRHSFTERCQGQLGFKLGAGAGYGARWGPVPVAGVFTGLRW